MSLRAHLSLILSTLLTARAAAQTPTPTPAPKAPPARSMAFAALNAEAVFDLAEARDLVASEDAMWVVSRAKGTLSRIDPSTNAVKATVSFEGEPCAAPVADFGSLLVPRCGPSGIERVDLKSNALADRLVVPVERTSNSMATGVGSLWMITDHDGTLARIDPVVGLTVAEIYSPPGATALAFGEGGLWVASPVQNLVTRINPYNNVIVESIAVPGGPSHLAVGAGSVWSWNREDGSVSRIDPKTNKVVATISLSPPADGEGGLAVLGGSVWVATGGTALTRIEARTNAVAQIFTGTGSTAIAAGPDSLWISGSDGRVLRFDPRRIEAARPPRGADRGAR